VDVRFAKAELDRLETDASFEGGYSSAVVRAYRKRIQLIRAAADERDFYVLKSLHFEKLKGDRAGQYSIRLNEQWRLVLRFEGHAPTRVVVVLGIEDYH
jgi:proteic killer suppression protein